MELTTIHKVFLNAATVIAWALGIVISVVAVAKGKKMRQEFGVSYKTYLALVGITEVFYAIGAMMILSSMGVNVMGHLARLEIWEFCRVVLSFDLSTIRIIGLVGWIGFIINRTISFVSPGYLLIWGGRKLPAYFLYSACTEVLLEIVTTALVFISLKYG